MTIVKGKTKPKGLRVVIYGVHGVGKTTLVSKLPNVLFADYEGGTHGIETAKIAGDELPQTYAGVKGTFEELKKDHLGFKTLVIDSADRLEDAFDKSYSKANKISSIFAVDDYFRTQKKHEKEFADVLDSASALVESGMNIVFVAHETVRKCEPLENQSGKSYDHSEVKLSKRCSQLLMEWADVVIFCAYRTYLVAGEKKGDKAHVEGGKRWCFTAYSNDWDAKHRECIKLPDDCSMDNMAKILPAAITEATAPSDVEAAPAKPAPEPPKAKKPSPPETTPSDKTPEKAEAPQPSYPAHISKFIGLIQQYDISEGQIRDYAKMKLNDRYGIDFGVTDFGDWPVDAVEWMCGGMDKIAQRIKK